MKLRSDAKLVRNEPTVRQQYTRGGAIAGTVHLAVQRAARNSQGANSYGTTQGTPTGGITP
eukprot:3459709-Alexandrium_andersonii.AAC.1